MSKVKVIDVDVFDIVKAKLPVDLLPDDTALAMDVAEVGQSILTYCNRLDIPKELVFTHANMVIDLITGEAKRNDTDSPGDIKSIKEGDVQVTYEATRASSREAHMEALLFNYQSQMNRFRKLRW
ncbi:hypothetical protein OR571_13230 [Psychrobacillus sp. NEAU-3TGS]|uniref:hypothetical protein n=1 Tax=Psychrobacillus sp. NEAU-3TGS TaxID=2995412 RepID=UPI00249998FD|nr:hypothetical protein [Psychrobacillus sp. NEAU-3TGS]MDI2588051.1 hypothetical protein [Psychrobacillus sp. NEAU-3TGS]